jgi:hypothetical protein
MDIVPTTEEVSFPNVADTKRIVSTISLQNSWDAASSNCDCILAILISWFYLVPGGKY